MISWPRRLNKQTSRRELHSEMTIGQGSSHESPGAVSHPAGNEGLAAGVVLTGQGDEPSGSNQDQS